MRVRTAIAGVAVALGAIAVARPVAGQPHSGNGFLFGSPYGILTLRGGFASPNEGSDLFSFVRKQLTVNRGDFASSSFGVDVAFFVRPRLAVQVGIASSERTIGSSYRDWVDNSRNEIEQTNLLKRTPMSAGLRYYLMPPGRALGELAWVPSRVSAYASAGVGITWYRFRQSGDFVDYQTLDVFPATLNSAGHATSQFAALGGEYTLSPFLALTGEARYDHANAKLASSFSGFDRMDLSGLAYTMGLSVRF